MSRAPLSPRGGWTTAAGTFDTAYLEDGNAQIAAIVGRRGGFNPHEADTQYGHLLNRKPRRDVGSCSQVTSGGPPASALDEGQEVRVDRVGMRGRHAVRKVFVALERTMLQEFR
jgi:hypothetical protein